MKRKSYFLTLLLIIGILVLGSNTEVHAAVPGETAFIFNTFSFLIHGLLVMFMACGFAMLESGLVRAKNTSTICLKNMALYSLAGLAFYVVGYSILYTDVNGGWIGSFNLFYNSSQAELDLINMTGSVGDATGAAKAKLEKGIAEASSKVIGANYSVMSDWFFQMVFVATAASIVSGTLAERIKVWPFLIFVVVLSAFIYPIQASWVWGAGWLSTMGFSDFAGSTLVHSTGGWAALAGAIILGARKGKYGENGEVNPMPGSNLPLATLGTFILWFGWFGFNGGSQLAMGSALDVTAISIVYVNTNLAAAGGVIAAMIATQLVYGKIDLTYALNGAIAGLVSITAGPDLQNHLISVLIGGVGGILVVVSVPLLDKFKIDDVVGAIPAHLIAGIWGTLCVGIFGSGSISTQLIGIVAIGVFVFFVSLIVWFILRSTVGIRAEEADEDTGLDSSEVGVRAYPEFTSK
ncbi:MAG: ammonium transporter [Rhodospirillaceae bacterium]|nr:ammonium transporter [Rhodospirillaceae bacterium]OUT80259.1 MAG: ammonium transporter [Rhodospirillaceae bacterium TMED23]